MAIANFWHMWLLFASEQPGKTRLFLVEETVAVPLAVEQVYFFLFLALG